MKCFSNSAQGLSTKKYFPPSPCGEFHVANFFYYFWVLSPFSPQHPTELAHQDVPAKKRMRSRRERKSPIKKSRRNLGNLWAAKKLFRKKERLLSVGASKKLLPLHSSLSAFSIRATKQTCGGGIENSTVRQRRKEDAA